MPACGSEDSGLPASQLDSMPPLSLQYGPLVYNNSGRRNRVNPNFKSIFRKQPQMFLDGNFAKSKKAFSQIKLRLRNLFGKGFDNGLRKVYTRHYSIVTNMHVSYQRFGSKDAG